MDPVDRIPGIVLTRSGEKYPSHDGRGILFFFLQKLIIGNTRGFIRGKTLAVTDDLTGYSPVNHNHDDRYYTETETDNLLNNKANKSHSHSTSDITSGTLSTSRLPTISVSKGGTGRTTLTSGYFLRGNGTSAVTMSSINDVKTALGISDNNGIKLKMFTKYSEIEPHESSVSITSSMNYGNFTAYELPVDFMPYLVISQTRDKLSTGSNAISLFMTKGSNFVQCIHHYNSYAADSYNRNEGYLDYALIDTSATNVWKNTSVLVPIMMSTLGQISVSVIIIGM